MKYSSRISGIRGVAIFLVVLGHIASPDKVFGFVGVDIFFVLSGFLITRSLVNDSNRRNLVGDVRGYQVVAVRFLFKRLRRIAPMAIFGASAIVVFTYIRYGEEKGRSTLGESFPAIFGYENFRLISRQKDYFVGSDLSFIFQHYWSLALETQFYLLLPLIYVISSRICSRTHSENNLSNLRVMNKVFRALTGLSFIYFTCLGLINSSAIYFSPLARFWEIGVGVIFAFLSSEQLIRITKVKLINKKSTLILFLSSFIMSLYGDDYKEFSIILAVFSALMCIALISGAIAQGKESFRFLGSSFFNVLGRYSYSIYIWYLPLFILMFPVSEDLSISEILRYLLALLALSFLSYHLIEKPFMQLSMPKILNGWLSNAEFRKILNKSESSVYVAVRGAVLFAAIVLPLLGFLFFASSNPKLSPQSAKSADVQASNQDLIRPEGVTKNSMEESSKPFKPKKTEKEVSKPPIDTTLAHWNLELSNSSKLEAIPFDQQGNLNQLLNVRNSIIAKCNQEFYKAFGCSFGNKNSTKTVLILGDSHAAEILEPLSEIFQREDWYLQSLNRSGCNIGSRELVLNLNGSLDKECIGHRLWALDQVRAIRPDLVIVSENSTLDEISVAALRQISKYSKKTIYLTFRPGSRNLLDCMDGNYQINRCFVKQTNADVQENQMVQKLKKYQIIPVSRRTWLCAREICPPIIANTPVYFDGVHFTPTFAKVIEPVINFQLRLVGVFSGR